MVIITLIKHKFIVEGIITVWIIWGAQSPIIYGLTYEETCVVAILVFGIFAILLVNLLILLVSIFAIYVLWRSA